MIEKIDTNQIPEPVDKLSPKQPGSAGVAPKNETDASLQVNYASLIDQATQPLQTDTQVLQQARELLLSGQLESPENIRQAAENIVKFGI